MDIVCLLAGMGGGTGGGMAPYVAKLTRNAGTLTIAMVTMPFAFEGIRVQRAANAIKRLKRQTARVIAFSNQLLADELGDSAMLDTIYQVQSWRIARHLRKLLRHLRGH
jgi:cell division protein FtsZ